MTLKEELERVSRLNITMLVGANECRKLLALLKAARDFHEWSQGGDDDSFYSTRDTLLNAIHAVEGQS